MMPLIRRKKRRNLEDHLRLKWMSEGLEDFPLFGSVEPKPTLANTPWILFADSNMGRDLRLQSGRGKDPSL